METGNTGYKRALWTVVLLNAGFGVVEMAGGFFSDSQALKADALDFLGDGLIAFVGIVALRWAPTARARVVLAQGVFLGALGLAVLITTLLRITGAVRPEAEVMGLLGGIGLLINLTAALVLLPYRTGDVNARAIWLFSRNDALGNIAVVISAGFVALTNSHWPDAIVAVVIAGLFLQSSWSIVYKARAQLRAA